jgi:hypothetical protein
MPKHLQVLLTLVCLVILVPVVFAILAAVAEVIGIFVLAVMEYADGLGRWFGQYGLIVSSIALGFFVFMGIRARNRPIPPTKSVSK